MTKPIEYVPKKKNWWKWILITLFVLGLLRLAMNGVSKNQETVNQTPPTNDQIQNPQSGNYFPRATPGQQAFDPNLVAEKQKCQDAFTKYNAANGYTGIRAHFNASLNTCLVDDIYFSRNGGPQTSTIIDIYDNNRKLVELDIFTQPELNIPAGEYLYVDGVKVDSSEPAKEYDRRSYQLLELPLPDYLK